jgi:hypothetical protein
MAWCPQTAYIRERQILHIANFTMRYTTTRFAKPPKEILLYYKKSRHNQPKDSRVHQKHHLIASQQVTIIQKCSTRSGIIGGEVNTSLNKVVVTIGNVQIHLKAILQRFAQIHTLPIYGVVPCVVVTFQRGFAKVDLSIRPVGVGSVRDPERFASFDLGSGAVAIVRENVWSEGDVLTVIYRVFGFPNDIWL